jgi:hypothetical protein
VAVGAAILPLDYEFDLPLVGDVDGHRAVVVVPVPGSLDCSDYFHDMPPISLRGLGVVVEAVLLGFLPLMR